MERCGGTGSDPDSNHTKVQKKYSLLSSLLMIKTCFNEKDTGIEAPDYCEAKKNLYTNSIKDRPHAGNLVERWVFDIVTQSRLLIFPLKQREQKAPKESQQGLNRLKFEADNICWHLW